MLTIKIQNVVVQLVNQFLADRPDHGTAMHFHFDIGLSDYEEGFRSEKRAGLHLLYWCRPGGRYITVFSAVTEKPFAKVQDVKDWKHEGTHDSEWRNVSAISGLYFDMANQINQDRVAAGLEKKAPILMTEHNNFVGFNRCFDFVGVDIKMDKDDPNQYRMLVEVLP